MGHIYLSLQWLNNEWQTKKNVQVHQSDYLFNHAWNISRKIKNELHIKGRTTKKIWRKINGWLDSVFSFKQIFYKRKQKLHICGFHKKDMTNKSKRRITSTGTRNRSSGKSENKKRANERNYKFDITEMLILKLMRKERTKDGILRKFENMYRAV